MASTKHRMPKAHSLILGDGRRQLEPHAKGTHEDPLETFLVLARILGRQAAREWLSADMYPSELNDED